MSPPRPTLRCTCEGRHLAPAFEYTAPPAGETAFDLGRATYCRAYDRCGLCGHFFSRHQLDLSSLYEQSYVDATYGSAERIRERFEAIEALPEERSDNAGRVACVRSYAARHLEPSPQAPTLLDVGAGLGVFPAAMRRAGWEVTALDPDPRAVRHLREVVGVAAVSGDFLSADLHALGAFDCVSFNKVLEHVEDPIAMLARARDLLRPGGFVYVELPDGEAASAEGPGREEFFIEHHHVFSPASTALLVERSGFRLAHLERLREASTKLTVRAFGTVA